MADSEFQDLSTLEGTSENLPDDVTTAETGRRLTKPGAYVSPSRTIKYKIKEETGHIVFELSSNEKLRLAPPRAGSPPLTDAELALTAFTPRTWVSTKPYKRQRDGVEFTTSQAAEYLNACGIKPPRTTSTAEWASAFAESQIRPVGYIIGWENEVTKNPDGSYPKSTRYTKHFNKGTKEEPLFQQEFEEDGVLYKARVRVERFFKVV